GRLPHIARELRRRQRRVGEAGAVAATLAGVAVALPAAVASEQPLAVVDVGGGRRLLLRERDDAGDQHRDDRDHLHVRVLRALTSCHRGCVTTSMSAGSPFLTTSSAALIAGPRSFGFSIGPELYMPYAFASVA